MSATSPVTVVWLSYLASARMGGQRNLLRIVERLDRGKIRSVVVPPGPGELGEALSAQGIEVQPLLRHDFAFHPGKAPTPRAAARTLRRAAALRRLIEREGASVVYADAPADARYAWLATRGLDARVLWHVQMSAPDPLWDAVTVASVDRIVGVSSGARRRLAAHAGFDLSRYETIANGVDGRVFCAEPWPDARQRLYPGAPEHAVLGVYIGQISQAKGIDELVVAACRLASRCPALHLTLLGEGDPAYVSALRERVEAAGARVRFAGHTSSLERLLQAADLMVFPSYTEGLPLSVLEAMASGLPVIASDIPGCSDLVDEQNGVRVPVRQVEALVEALVALSNDGERRRALGRAGRERALTEFSLERCVGRFEATLVGLAAEAPRSMVQAALASARGQARS